MLVSTSYFVLCAAVPGTAPFGTGIIVARRKYLLLYRPSADEAGSTIHIAAPGLCIAKGRFKAWPWLARDGHHDPSNEKDTFRQQPSALQDSSRIAGRPPTRSYIFTRRLHVTAALYVSSIAVCPYPVLMRHLIMDMRTIYRYEPANAPCHRKI